MRSQFALCAILAALVAASSCDGSAKSQLRQGTTSYRFDIISPAGLPVAHDSLTYVIFVRDRNTGQPIENGEGRIFARAGAVVAGTFAKAPQVGQYIGRLELPSAGGWVVSIRFRDRAAKELELTQWVQEVRSASPAQKVAWVVPPWLWHSARK